MSLCFARQVKARSLTALASGVSFLQSLQVCRQTQGIFLTNRAVSTSCINHLPIIQSPFKPLNLHKKYNSLVELLIAKSKEHKENGKGQWMTDSLTGESFDFGSFEDISKRIGSALYKRGLRKGDIVIFMEIDIVKQPAFLGGVWRANGIGRASYPEDAEDEDTIFQRVKESQARWVYCEPMHAPVCLKVGKKMEWDVEVIVTSKEPVAGCTSIYELMQDDGSALPKLEVSPEDTALIMCTSGTTGASKGAVLTQACLLWQVCTTAHGAPVSQDKDWRILMLTKSTHISGIVTPFGTLVRGTAGLYLTFISRETILSVVGKWKPNFIFGFPTFLLLLVHDPEAAKLDLSNLYAVASGGAPITTTIEKELMTLPSVAAVINLYGVTECVPIASSLSYDNGKPIEGRPEGSMGQLAPGVVAKFIDLKTGKSLGPGEMGELCVKAEGMFKEYLLQPEQTKNAFVEGYFKTGDVGYYDEKGFFFLVDRAKEIFKYYNNHVSPTEIENIILQHPAIGEVCVVGVPDPEGGGQIPRAFCVKCPNSKLNVTTTEVLEYANANLAGYKKLRGGLYFLDKLPLGKTGKVARHIIEKIQVGSMEYKYFKFK